MSASSLPDFDQTLQLSQGRLDAPELAECHGLLCGMVCRESSRTPGDFLDQLSAMELVVRPGQALNAALADAWRSTVEQLEDEDMGFTLWLPDDEASLENRTVALAQWCSGFLAGLGSAGPLEALSDEAREAIADLQEISRAELAPADDGKPAGEDDEVAYTEIVEYVRIVALMMREDFRGPKSGEVIH
jgi:uncharacterized protein YgfB (UPF0149 family)